MMKQTDLPQASGHLGKLGMIRAEVKDGRSGRIFTDEFKAEAVRLVTVEGHSARQVARDLG